MLKKVQGFADYISHSLRRNSIIASRGTIATHVRPFVLSHAAMGLLASRSKVERMSTANETEESHHVHCDIFRSLKSMTEVWAPLPSGRECRSGSTTLACRLWSVLNAYHLREIPQRGSR
jgi:hypothetical protein